MFFSVDSIIEYTSVMYINLVQIISKYHQYPRINISNVHSFGTDHFKMSTVSLNIHQLSIFSILEFISVLCMVRFKRNHVLTKTRIQLLNC